MAKNQPAGKRRRGGRHASAPIEITEGSVTVKIYHTPTKAKSGGATRTYPMWTLRYHLHDKWHREKSSKLADLMEKGRTAARRIANAQTATLTMTDAQVAEWTAVKEKVPAGASLLAIVEQHNLVDAILQGKVSHEEAARYYIHRNKDITPITTAKVVEEFLKTKTAEGCGARHLYDLKNRLARWTDHFQCNIADLFKADVQAWLRSLKGGPQTKLHHLRAVSNLCNFAKINGHLPEAWNELKNISAGILPETIIGTYTPAQLETILRGALGEIALKSEVTWKVDTRTASHTITDHDRAAFKATIPFIVTGAFAGLRTAERCRTRWSDFNWETERIHVTGKRTKGRNTRSNSRRLVPIHPALRDWLEPFIPKPGTPDAEKPIVPVSQYTALERFRLLCLAGDIDPIENGLRHSYISYRCAELKGDKSTVASESGNSVTTINKHYLDLKTPAQAAAWFALRREQSPNITQLKAVV